MQVHILRHIETKLPLITSRLLPKNPVEVDYIICFSDYDDADRARVNMKLLEFVDIVAVYTERLEYKNVYLDHEWTTVQ